MCRLRLKWLFILAAATAAATAVAAAGGTGSSLRGALEALQRRQRGPRLGPLRLDDYPLDDNYGDYAEPPYQGNDGVSNELLDSNVETPEEKIFLDYLPNNENPKLSYNDRKTAFRERLENDRGILSRQMNSRKRASAFRERGHSSDQEDKETNDMFINKILDNDGMELERQYSQNENDREYAELLNELWNKYRMNHKFSEVDTPSDKVIWLYKDVNNQKRQYPDDYMTNKAWGPVAFKKRKRNTIQHINHKYMQDDIRNSPQIDLSLLKKISEDSSEGDAHNAEYSKILDLNEIPPYDIAESDNPDMTEEIGIAFQPLDNQNLEYSQNNGGNPYLYNTNIDKRFPVTKRSNSEYPNNFQRSKSENLYKIRMARSGFGTNPKVLKDLSDIFGNMESSNKLNIKKRSEPPGVAFGMSPQISALSHNYTNADYNNTMSLINETDKDDDHQHAPHAFKHGTDRSEADEINRKKRENIQIIKNSPIVKKEKRSFQWSDYFGIDKRQKKSIPISEDFLKKRFLNMFKNKMTTEMESTPDSYESNNSFDSGHVSNIDIKQQSIEKVNKDTTPQSKDVSVTHNPLFETKKYQSGNNKQPIEHGKELFSKNMEAITIDEVLNYGNDKHQKSDATKEFTFNVNQNKFKREVRDMYTLRQPNPYKTMGPFYIGPMKRAQEPLGNEQVNDFKLDRATILAIEEKRDPKRMDPVKLDNMDNKLKNLEMDVVEDATNISEHSDGLDTKEEQEMRERILSRLAAAYSLEKMRKALKEFKHSLKLQKNNKDVAPPSDDDTIKEKKVPQINLLKNDIPYVSTTNMVHNADTTLDKYFEAEQGAGQFSNGKTEKPFSEGYMGGSGRRDEPDEYDGKDKGNCPSLDKIVKKCRRIDILAGDHGQLFLPLCSLHQICYLCGTLSETGCDLIFISEADSLCNNQTECLQAARNTIMLLRELHESLADNLEGECENNPCLRNTLQYSPNWWSRE